eukprot:340375-Amphidinium_carterae.1
MIEGLVVCNLCQNKSHNFGAAAFRRVRVAHLVKAGRFCTGGCLQHAIFELQRPRQPQWKAAEMCTQFIATIKVVVLPLLHINPSRHHGGVDGSVKLINVDTSRAPFPHFASVPASARGLHHVHRM